MLSLKKLFITLAGPLVNIIFIIYFINFKQNVVLIYVNIIIFIFNMITIYPLDGGRALKYILSIFLGKQKALNLIYIISNITTIVLSIAILVLSIILRNIALIFPIVYIWIITIKENKKYKMRRKMYKILENYIAIN